MSTGPGARPSGSGRSTGQRTQHAGRLDDFFLLVEQAFARTVGWHDKDWPLPGARRARAPGSDRPHISLTDLEWHLLGGRKANGLWGLYRGHRDGKRPNHHGASRPRVSFTIGGVRHFTEAPAISPVVARALSPTGSPPRIPRTARGYLLPPPTAGTRHGIRP